MEDELELLPLLTFDINFLTSFLLLLLFKYFLQTEEPDEELVFRPNVLFAVLFDFDVASFFVTRGNFLRESSATEVAEDDAVEDEDVDVSDEDVDDGEAGGEFCR